MTILINTISNVTLTSYLRDVSECARCALLVDADVFFFLETLLYLMNTRFLNQCRCHEIQDFKSMKIKDIFLILIITITYRASITISIFFYVIDLIEYNTMSYFDHYIYYYPDFFENVLRDFLAIIDLEISIILILYSQSRDCPLLILHFLIIMNSVLLSK